MEEPLPGISVVIPTLNRSRYLLALLSSLQTAANNFNGQSEVIIIDDSSPMEAEATRKLCEQYGAHYLPGVASVREKRNLGIRHARYPIVLFVDSDCQATPELFTQHAHIYADADPTIGGVVGVTEFVGEDGYGRFSFDRDDIAGSLQHLKGSIEQQPIVLDQIAVEFKSQIKRYRDMGVKLKHLNIHHYLALLHPKLFEVYALTAESAGVAFRGLCFPMLELLETPATQIAQMTEAIHYRRVPAPAISISNLADACAERPTALEYQRMMEEKIADLAMRDRLNTVELVTHPTAPNASFRQDDGYAWARELETALVTSQDFSQVIKNLGYEVGGYGALAA